MIYFFAICSFLLIICLVIILVIRYWRNYSYFDDDIIPRCYGSELYKQDGFYKSSCWKCDFVGECIDCHEGAVKSERVIGNARQLIREEEEFNVSESRLSEDQTEKEDVAGSGKEN